MIRRRRKVVCVSTNVEHKRQTHRKPPRHVGRIACEILAGTITGFVVAWVALYVILGANADKFRGCFGGFVALGYLFVAFPMVYGPASAIGVYLVGSRGEQTGSFLLALAGGFLGGIVMLFTLFGTFLLSGVLIVGAEQVVVWACWALVFLTGPTMATLVFNLTRRYKQPPAS